jgi:predicted metalloenzyme YecM
MRQIAVDTYPDPQHFLRVNLNRFASHSNRVTAAVALSQSGMTVDDIAQRLRWKPESVAFYLRESAQDIGDYTSNAIAGAQRNFC